MLERSQQTQECRHPWGPRPRPFLSRDITAVVATEPWQLAGYWELRADIFGREQGLFEGSDEDEHDRKATPIVAISHIAGMPDQVVGVVRIYPEDGGVWYGGRLGVRHSHRRVGAVGGALIFTAVSTAHAWGCSRFLATVQQRNQRYFERHHFRSEGRVEVCGRPHCLMRAELMRFPPVATASQPRWGGRAA